MKTLLSTVFLSLAPLTAAIGAPCSAHSPPHTVALLELYTSEGCSSCPPADRFVHGLRAESRLGPDRLILLSLHVDYWDDIGWKDVFAQHAFTERQRWLSGLAYSHTIYTPEVFLAGRELRDWRHAVVAAVKRINAQPALAELNLTLSALADGKLPVHIDAKTSQRADLFVALYENGLASHVRAGENRGETLRHEYVVRDLIGPLALSTSPDLRPVTLPRSVRLPPDAVARNLAVAAFVQAPNGDVLQAVELPVCRTAP